jgi:hypothetical protein
VKKHIYNYSSCYKGKAEESLRLQQILCTLQNMVRTGEALGRTGKVSDKVEFKLSLKG